MESWVESELQYANLGDKRRNERLKQLVADLSSQPGASVPEACEEWAATKAAYRFWANAAVEADEILDSHRQMTLARCVGEGVVLAVQDTSELDYAQHSKMRGMGPLNNEHQQGMKFHTTLAVSVEGVPLGVLHQERWVRAWSEVGSRGQRRQRTTAEKESQRWLNALAASEGCVPAHVAVVTIADSEADIYDLFAQPRRPGSQLLIRAAHNRNVNEAGHLWETVGNSPVQGEYSFDLQRKADRPARPATVAVRFTPLWIQPPQHRRQDATLTPVPLTALLVEEPAPPPGEPAVTWLLLTTLPVASLDDALRMVRWYTYRWLIERFHFVLKSGCRLEELQLETADRIERAFATYCIVAWRLLWLTYQARRHPDLPADLVLQTHEWQALYCTIHQHNLPPPAPPSLAQAIRWIAQLGGFLARKSDGDPGVKTLWRGLRRLHDIAHAWLLFHPSSHPAHSHISSG